MENIKKEFENLVKFMAAFDLFVINDDLNVVVDNLRVAIFGEPTLELQPIAVGRIEYDFPQEVYTIANEDNTEIVCDVYEDDFNKLCSMGIIKFLLEEGDEERFSIKGNCSDYLLKSNEFIPIAKKRQIDLSKVPVVEEVVEKPLPNCVKINGKIFLYGSERYEVVVNDNDLGMIELFDITTEIETGDSYSIFVSDISYFEVACNEDRQRVREFLEFVSQPS